MNIFLQLLCVGRGRGTIILNFSRKLIESLYKEDRKKVIEVEVEAARQKRRNDEVIHELRRRHAVGQPPGIPNKDETTKYKRRMQIIQYLNEKVN